MESKIKIALQKFEDQIEVPRESPHALTKQLFAPRPKRTVLLVFFTTASACALFFLASVLNKSPLPSPLEPLSVHEVLAKSAEASTSVAPGTISVITRTFTSPQFNEGVPSVEKLWTDGTNYLLEKPQIMHPENSYRIWMVAHAGSNTRTEYRFDEGENEIHRMLWFDDKNRYQNFFSALNSRGSDNPIALCDDQGNCEDVFVSDFIWPYDTATNEQNAEISVIPPVNQELYYRIQITGLSDNSASPSVPSSYEFFINKETYRLEHSTRTGAKTSEVIYQYQTLSPEELDHPFTLEWWKSSVNPEGDAPVVCHIHGFTCDVAAQKDYIDLRNSKIPEGWLEGRD